eukprot:TRINITY_DN1743_c0_g1_i9.p1 TRINITY_DN1743_c0_g1~~TRINITY_DN1743_c0_g1_i9.p1  ORF type:complete len:552 (+),score=21.50 TRINITY_DN1743_c0_g1_i9:210-1865(+)
MASLPVSAQANILQRLFHDQDSSLQWIVNLRLISKRTCLVVDLFITHATPRTLSNSQFNTLQKFVNLRLLDLTKLYYTCAGRLWSDDDVDLASNVISRLSNLSSLTINIKELRILSFLEAEGNSVNLTTLVVQDVFQVDQIRLLQQYIRNQNKITLLGLTVAGVGDIIDLTQFLSSLMGFAKIRDLDLVIARATISIALSNFQAIKNLSRLGCQRIRSTHQQLCQSMQSLKRLKTLSLGELQEDKSEEQPTQSDWQSVNNLQKLTVSVIDGASIRALKRNQVTSLQSLGAMSLFCPGYTLKNFGLESVKTLNLCAHGKHVSYTTNEINSILCEHPNATTVCVDAVDNELFEILCYFPHLTHVVLDLYGDFEQRCNGLSTLAEMEELKLIQFQNTNFKKLSKQQLKLFFDAICELRIIDVLKIEFPVQLNSSISSLSQLSQLCLLWLSNIEQDCDIEFLRNMPFLFNLQLGGSGVAGVVSIDPILNLKYCKSLDLMGLILQKDQLYQLRSMTQLSSLKCRVFAEEEEHEMIVRRLESALPLLRSMQIEPKLN